MTAETTTTAFAEQVAWICRHAESCVRDEAQTRVSLINPFLRNVLGWDTADPQQVKTEYHIYNVDGSLRGDVDYAVLGEDGQPLLLVEAKHVGANLADSKTLAQLFDYHARTELPVIVLWNGTHFWAYADLDRENRMDAEPYRKVDLCAAGEGDEDFILSFRRAVFSQQAARNRAIGERRKQAERERARARRAEQAGRIREAWAALTSRPSDELVGMLLRQAGIQFAEDDVDGYRELIVDEIEAMSDDAAGDVVDVALEVGSGQATTLTAAARIAMRESGGSEVGLDDVEARCRELAPPSARQLEIREGRPLYNKSLQAILSGMIKRDEIERTGRKRYRATGLLAEGS